MTKVEYSPDAVDLSCAEHHNFGVITFADGGRETSYGPGDRHQVGAGSGRVIMFIGALDRPLGIYHAIVPADARRLADALLKAADDAEWDVPAGAVVQ